MLVIIGLIVGGVLVGQDLIKAAQARATITQIEKYHTAVNTFRGKYGELPGDISAAGASQFGFAPRGPDAGQGDGNGVIEGFCCGPIQTLVSRSKEKPQLGSGIADYWLNGIVQKTLSPRLTYRLNSGILFSGNTLTGAIGVRSTRGLVFTGASSLTVALSKRWLIGGEIAGALTQQFNLGKGQLQVQAGAKFALRKSIAVDFAATGGKLEGSPRLGGALGISIDF